LIKSAVSRVGVCAAAVAWDDRHVLSAQAAMTRSIPPLYRRFACLFYELLLLLALLFFADFVIVGLTPATPSPLSRLAHQTYFLLVGGVYFVWYWRHGGQTLAMKTWRIRLVNAADGPIGLGQAWLRYLLAVAGTICAGLGFLWAFWDRDRQFLHDRLAGTRLVDERQA
jgi:uncharacterized RDD family membrane protein YckC